MDDLTWFFDGSGGCEICGEMTGEYDEQPGRPHPNCACSITQVKMLEECSLVDRQEDRYLVDRVKEYIEPGTQPNSWWIRYNDEYEVSTVEWWRCCKYVDNVMTDDCSDDVRSELSYEIVISGPFLETEV